MCTCLRFCQCTCEGKIKKATNVISKINTIFLIKSEKHGRICGQNVVILLLCSELLYFLQRTHDLWPNIDESIKLKLLFKKLVVHVNYFVKCGL